MAESKTQVVIGSSKLPVRFSYAHFFTPVEDEDGKVDKKTGKILAFYSCQVIISKDDKESIKAINDAVAAAAAEKLNGKKMPSTWKTPLRDGDEEWEEKNAEHLKGHYFFNCKSKTKPSVVGTRKVTEEDVEEWDVENEQESSDYKAKNRPKVGKYVRLADDQIKSGDYGRISVNFYYFENESKGIAAGLNNVQLLREGEALGGGKTDADADFGDLEDGFED